LAAVQRPVKALNKDTLSQYFHSIFFIFFYFAAVQRPVKVSNTDMLFKYLRPSHPPTTYMRPVCVFVSLHVRLVRVCDESAHYIYAPCVCVYYIYAPCVCELVCVCVCVCARAFVRHP
jgi:hypothetical protein